MVGNPSLAHMLPKRLSIEVSDVPELHQALSKANATHHTDIILHEGTYQLDNTLNVAGSHITLRSQSGNPKTVVLLGKGMQPTKGVNNIIRVSGSHFILDGITLAESGNHLVQIAGEQNADYPTLRNCILKDAYEQLVKVSYNQNTGIASDFGRIENCHFSYSAGIGPQYYIGGIDVHGGQDWIVTDNTFVGIASPGKKVAEHAIHFWTGTKNITIESNTIVNCDRGIGFGMPNRPNFGGTINQNLIIHGDRDHPNADTGIALEESRGTQVTNNRIYFKHDYPNAIEYRFKQTKNVYIANNWVNKGIVSRNGGQAELRDNRAITHLKDLLSADEYQRWAKYLN